MANTRVLLVDDEPVLVETLTTRLEDRELVVAGAGSGPEAIALIQQQAFDVMVLDLSMPGMDGLEVLRSVKELQPYLQVIMFTGHGSIDAALESGRWDAFRFLEKPVEIGDLAAAIGEAHEEKRRQLKEAYLAELDTLHGQGYSPREILSETERLKKLYEQ